VWLKVLMPSVWLWEMFVLCLRILQSALVYVTP
jgi:hypothetical protein